VLFAGYLAVQSAVLLIALSFIGDSLQQADNTALRVASDGVGVLAERARDGRRSGTVSCLSPVHWTNNSRGKV
jgi:hypothetical protein